MRYISSSRASGLLLICGLCASIAMLAVPVLTIPASASALPTYNGSLSFPAISGPDSPEDFSWSVSLVGEEELKPLGDDRAGVFWPDGTTAMVIRAEHARDALGRGVPTTLSVIGPDTVTLTVHHQAGNPAAGGAPFLYPVNAGEPFEAGPSLVSFFLEHPTGNEASVQACLVPKLKNRTLRAARARLEAAHCRLGVVKGVGDVMPRSARVVRQFPRRGAELGPGAVVDLTLGKVRRRPFAEQ